MSWLGRTLSAGFVGTCGCGIVRADGDIQIVETEPGQLPEPAA